MPITEQFLEKYGKEKKWTVEKIGEHGGELASKAFKDTGKLSSVDLIENLTGSFPRDL